MRNITTLLATALAGLLTQQANTNSPQARQAKRALKAHRQFEADQAKLATRVLGPATDTATPEPGLRSIIAAAESFISGFEDDPSQKGVAALLAQLRTANQKLDLQSFAVDRLRDMIDASEEVIANWEHGDLANAVNNLEDWADTAKSELEAFSRHCSQPAVVVEISGGNCSGVSARGPVRVLVLDYDNGECADDDDASCPEIPGRHGSRASIGDSRGPSDPDFVDRVCALADAGPDEDLDEEAA